MSQVRNHIGLNIFPSSKFFRNIPKFSRPLNSGIVESMNIPILVDRAGVSSMDAAVADAVARLLLFIYRSSLTNSSSVKFAVPPSSSFKSSLLYSVIFSDALQKTCTSRSFNSRIFQVPSLSVIRNPSSTGLMVTCYGLYWADDVSLTCR